MNYTWLEKSPAQVTNPNQKRSTPRLLIALPARLAWKDQRGVSRFASVITRDVSEFGAFVECYSQLSIPLYRLVQFQLEPTVRETTDLPGTLRNGRVVAAVYRVAHSAKGGKFGLALRLMVEPNRQVASVPEKARATA
ncbi:MAG: hypothetical protein C5B57_03940 [Blastocatellia bacterium]|nr:MAG: hypothetical protein C5B57_03940 [Blastocatellia bacterium]